MKYRAAILLTLGLAAPAVFADESEKINFFEKKIRPVLVDSCLQCHDDAKQSGKLRLDSKMAVLKGGVSGPALVPGKAKDSLLIKAIRHADPDLKMPAKADKLPDTVIADFEKWIDMGAADPRDGSTPVKAGGIAWETARTFWSFQPPKKPDLPKVLNAGWVKQPIDRFILAKLEAEKLAPVRPATRRELIRRATFDLTGLPPTPAEVEAFLRDDSANAFAKVIDRLLASPHYGERWGRHWLDVARYAEDQAHRFAVIPNTNAWRYRDWVIAALNDDMPYDRFIRMQLAADMIDEDEAVRIKNLPALGFIGLGAQYYKDVAQQFNNEAAKALADELDDRVDTVTRGFLGLTVSCARCHDHKYDPIPQIDYYSLAGIFNSCKIDNLTLAAKDVQERVKKHQDLIKKVDDDAKATVRAENSAFAEKFKNDVARYLMATRHFQLTRIKEPGWTIEQQAKADNLDPAYVKRCLEYLKTPPNGTALNIFKRYKADEDDKALEFARDFERKGNDALKLRDKKKTLNKSQTVIVGWLFGDDGVFAPSVEVLKSKLTPEQINRWEDLKAQLAKLQASEDAKPLAIAHAVVETKAEDMKVMLRGNPATLGQVAPRRFLHILSKQGKPRPFTHGSGRLDLADAIASRDNPLTARVMVNRVWHHHFGRPLVGSTSNFGHLGSRPSHPELLDYLACRFMESNWSLKTLHREIMLSATYQLSSEKDDGNFARDSDNRWLWRMNRRRLDVESWRDAMLAVSGKLDAALGGPTTNLADADNRRRTVYAKISRYDLSNLLRLFDFPDPNVTSERRSETTVPQQQLFVLNSPFVAEVAKGLAARLQKESTSDVERVQRAFALTYARPPSAEEVRIFTAFLNEPEPPAEAAQNRLTPWERLAQVLLGSNEFMYVD